MRRSWNRSGEDFVVLDGIADALRTVGFALISSGMDDIMGSGVTPEKPLFVLSE